MLKAADAMTNFDVQSIFAERKNCVTKVDIKVQYILITSTDCVL